MALEKQRVTVDAYERFLAQPENAERRFELIDGEIVEMSPTFTHGELAVAFAAALQAYLRATGAGRVAVEARFRPVGDAFNDRIPDVAVVLAGRTPPLDGPVPFMPEVAVEIKSPSDSLRLLRQKARFYIDHGARLVWLVVPEKAYVDVFTTRDEYMLLESDTLTGEDVLPGFSLPLADVFAGLR